jgi:putative ABC transport system substrate-binding protein
MKWLVILWHICWREKNDPARLVCGLILGGILLFPGSGALAQKPAIVILKSEDIEPYSRLIEGVKNDLSANWSEYNLKKDLLLGEKILGLVSRDKPALLIAVGAHALKVAIDHPPGCPVMFTMVLSPAKIQVEDRGISGISLNIPIDFQLRAIRQTFPLKKRIGLLYDPQKNRALLDEIKRQGQILGLTLQPVAVQSEKDIPTIFKAHLARLDILWLIPDSTVIRESNITFLLENSLLNRIPVVGFNPALARMGAILAFSIDYTRLGQQTAQLAREILAGKNLSGKGRIFPPERIELVINRRVAEKLGIRLPQESLDSAREVTP